METKQRAGICGDVSKLQLLGYFGRRGIIESDLLLPCGLPAPSFPKITRWKMSSTLESYSFSNSVLLCNFFYGSVGCFGFWFSNFLLVEFHVMMVDILFSLSLYIKRKKTNLPLRKLLPMPWKIDKVGKNQQTRDCHNWEVIKHNHS